MIASRLLLIGSVLAAAITNACGAAAQLLAENARCVYPNPYTLVGNDVAGIDRVAYMLFDRKAGPMRWLFLSWTDPQDGMALMLACDGHVGISLTAWSRKGS